MNLYHLYTIYLPDTLSPEQMKADDTVYVSSILETLQKALTRKVHYTFRDKSPVTIEQSLILSYLCSRDNISQQTLCELTHKDKPSITRLINKLEYKKYVRRVPDAMDKRKKLIMLTTDGRLAYKIAKDTIRQISDKAIADIDRSQLNVFWSVLHKLVNNL